MNPVDSALPDSVKVECEVMDLPVWVGATKVAPGSLAG